MKRWMKGAIMAGAVCGAGIGASGQEGEAGAPIGKQLADQYKATFADGGMERWQEAMTPQLAHEFLVTHFVGTWRTTATMGDQGNPLEWTATAKPILGGRYVEQRAEGEWMGQPAESLMILGYDNVRRLFHMTAYDTMGTGVKTLWGGLDQTGTVLTFVGDMDEPMSGEVGKAFMTVYTFNEDGSHDYEIKEILYGDTFTVIKAHSERVE